MPRAAMPDIASVACELLAPYAECFIATRRHSIRLSAWGRLKCMLASMRQKSPAQRHYCPEVELAFS